MEYGTFMNQLSLQERHKLGADLVLPIMNITGSHAPMHFLARELGGIYVAMPKQAGMTALSDSLLASVKEFGEYVAESAKDIADGYLPRDQYDRIQKEGQEALAAILNMLEVARQVHQKQYGSVNNTAPQANFVGQK